MNKFRHIDALEYADAFRKGVTMTAKKLGDRRARLDARIDKLEREGKEIPSYLLAAWRGYEAALIFRAAPKAFAAPFIVTLDETVGREG
ncbi:MAG TPA: hypothetical protein VFF11_03005 [Candidatus Binatia bacterium]|nr:hypothetical protein [Candidatus Binatia bacterium]